MKMRILVGASVLLAIACGFPTGAPPTATPDEKPSVDQLIDEFVNHAKAAASEATEETSTAESKTASPKFRDDLAMIFSVFDAAKVPHAAGMDFIDQGLHLVSDDEQMTAHRMNEWARKWGIFEQLKEAAATVTPSPTTASSPQIRENIDEILELFHAANVPQEAIEDFVARGLHLDTDEDESTSMQRSMEWAQKWNVLQRLEEAANARHATATPEPEETTTVSDATTTPAYETTTTAQDAAEAIIRERFSKMGFPEEAIEEYFALGLASDNQDEEWQSLFNAWCNKWKHTSTHYNEAKAMSQEIMNEVAQIFEKTYMTISIMQALSYYDEQPTTEQMDIMQTYYNNLSEYEKDLVYRVMEHVGEKVTKRFMEKIEAEKRME